MIWGQMVPAVARATRQERTVRVPCVAHAPFWPILSISYDLRLVLHVDNSFLRFGTLDTPSGIENKVCGHVKH